MATGDVVKIERTDRYHVEIQHPGMEWTHIHPPAWETTTNPATARAYADHVESDHPGSDVRTIHTQALKVTKVLTGTTRTMDVGAEVMGH